MGFQDRLVYGVAEERVGELQPRAIHPHEAAFDEHGRLVVAFLDHGAQ
jgi:hypothetical protein